MEKENIIVVGIPILYNILEENKDILSFNIKNCSGTDDFLKSFNEDKSKNASCLIVTDISNKNFFLQTNKKNFNNIFFLYQKKVNIDDEEYNLIKYPIDFKIFIEKVNIQLIKNKYSSQSKILINNYTLDLNSKIISKDKKILKLTEREMEIIIFLNENKNPQKINDLQSKVWGYSSQLETHTVETHVYRLRKKINDKFNDNKFLLSTDKGYLIK
mgnify:CR=1 FL=1|tara:strand:+ start:312 stop:956 length:645 start_codon:yes stop_codon:yes gene_type:complete